MATRINSVSVAEALHVEEEASGISATQAELVGGLHSNQNARMYDCIYCVVQGTSLIGFSPILVVSALRVNALFLASCIVFLHSVLILFQINCWSCCRHILIAWESPFDQTGFFTTLFSVDFLRILGVGDCYCFLESRGGPHSIKQGRFFYSFFICMMVVVLFVV